MEINPQGMTLTDVACAMQSYFYSLICVCRLYTSLCNDLIGRVLRIYIFFQTMKQKTLTILQFYLAGL